MKVKVFPVLTDNGDGGFTMHFYSSAKERTKEHPGVDEEEDPYEVGYLCETTEIEIEKDGSFKAFSIHAGQ